MSKLEEIKKKFDKSVENYKTQILDLEKINNELNEELLIEVKKIIKEERFTLKLSADDNGKFILAGSDRVILKLHNLRQYGMVVYLNKDTLLLIESGTLVIPKYFDVKMLADLKIDVDTSELENAIIELEKMNRFLKNPGGEIYDVPDSGSIISDNSL